MGLGFAGWFFGSRNNFRGWTTQDELFTPWLPLSAGMTGLVGGWLGLSLFPGGLSVLLDLLSRVAQGSKGEHSKRISLRMKALI